MTKTYIDPFGPTWQLRPYRLLFGQWQGSIFQCLWVEWLVATLLAAFFLVVWYLCFRGQDVTADIVPHIQGIFFAADTLFTRFQAALGLMLGFYTSTVYGRWWAVRTAEGVVMGRINDLSIQIAAMVREMPPPPSSSSSSLSKGNSKKAEQVRLTLVRWLNLAHALVVGELYEKKPNEFSSLQGLVDIGLMTTRELEYFVANPTSRYAAIFVWFHTLICEIKDKKAFGITNDESFLFSSNISLIRGSLADLYMYRNVPLPLSYRQLVTFTVRMYMALIMALFGLHAMKFMDGAYDTQVFWSILPFCFEYFLFVGWSTAADALGNPFRTWSDELEWDQYVRSIAISSNLFVTAPQQVMPTSILDDLSIPDKDLESKRIEQISQWQRVLSPSPPPPPETKPVSEHGHDAINQETKKSDPASKVDLPA